MHQPDDRRTNAYAHGNRHTDTNADTYPDAHAHTDINAYSYPDAHANTHTYPDAYTNAYTCAAGGNGMGIRLREAVPQQSELQQHEKSAPGAHQSG